MGISSPALWTEFFERYYREEINKLAYKLKSGGDGRSLYVNFVRDLSIFQEGKLGEELIEKPDEVLVHAERGLANATNIYGVSLEGCKPRFYSLPTARKVLIRNLRAEHIGKFMAIEGIVRKVTEVRPRIVEAAFACLNCGSITMVPQEDSQLRQPFECSKCSTKKMIFLPDSSISVDSQRVKIQEYPENLRGGEQPQTIDVILEGDLAGSVNPGDRVIINGIVRAKPRGLGQRKMTHMDLYIEGNSVEVLQQEYEEFEITEKDRELIMQLAASDDIYEKIVKSIAPSIYGHEDVKLAIALQLFGGVPKKLPDGTEIRGDIHILLVGDPGVAKSQLLKYVHRIAPRSVYTTGKGTTTAGLTATAVRDEVDGRWTLEAGALVLADKGIALVDEIDKMRKEDTSALHEALEQQTISVAKAGINAILKARCALLGAANPKYGRFEKFTPVPEQIEMSPTLLSRFDLIFVLKDEPDEEKDKRLVEHILYSHQLGEMTEKAKNVAAEYDEEFIRQRSERIVPEIDPDLLRKYIAYARKTVYPVLTDEAKEKIKEFYLSLRSRVKENSPVPITARQLESIVRLAEASARVRLSDRVEPEDVDRVIEIMMRSLREIAVDPETGEMDIDLAYSGTSKTQRDRIMILKKIIEQLEEEHERGVPEELILEEAEKEGIDRTKAKEILSKLKLHGEVYTPKHGHYKLVSKL
ncbi:MULTISPECIES: minichromosome maintenance protein MCM [Archaeoglobus]|jgi:replicative DNA helicase Mcm|nr:MULTISPECIES: minichromosome maintenance protein MCM [Archaeoglobus]CAE05930.1 Mcm protein [Archaeoglobus fulgidus DSM 4304]AIG97334.1 putative ATPase involved in replication control, Cdc46/Mcm family [Archaeoglobus fulgidus DSM 8774]KUJ93592.1 MAG: Cell division control protein 21 (Cdc21) [Archaeoglobus fulgidus]KUK07147.1 MAG: Cell division control protein 21 (Cdc21) [Archaeoglobus fulgidus]MDI3496963.1 replicative helicase Mcm [Archaeoglobus sp.]